MGSERVFRCGGTSRVRNGKTHSDPIFARPMSGRGDRPVAPTGAWMHAPPGLSGYASGQPDLWIPKRIYPTLDE